MSDIQISNARRVVFTAMAVVTLWTAATGVYDLACGWRISGMNPDFREPPPIDRIRSPIQPPPGSSPTTPEA